MFDFAARNPETNATLIYGGDRSSTMLAAAAAWDGLAVNLQTSAASYKAVVTRLVSEQWLGPSSLAMAAKLMPYTLWMDATAVKAEQAGIQAKLAAAAFDAAFAATVPPPLIFANRAQIQALTATNFLGINTAAIMALETLYMEMWVQCATAMYGYAATASAASALAPFGSPQQKPANAVAQGSDGEENVAGNSSSVLNQLSGSSGFMDSPGTSGWGPNANIWNTITSSGAANPAVVTSMMGDMAMISTIAGGGDLGILGGGSFQPGGVGIGSALSATSFVSATSPATTGAGLAGASTGAGLSGAAPATARMSAAKLVGNLSVPQSWSALNPGSPASGMMPGHSPAGGHAGGPGAPGVPLAGTGARAGSSTGPRYGIRPTVMSRPPAAGFAADIV